MGTFCSERMVVFRKTYFLVAAVFVAFEGLRTDENNAESIRRSSLAEAFSMSSGTFKPRERKVSRTTIVCHSNPGESDNDSAGTQKDMNLLTKSSWYAVELFGKAFGNKDSKQEEGIDGPPKSLDETLRRIQDDNDRSYFLSGQIDTQIYDPDCVFADPFVSFSGRDRFVENLQNLGSFITKYDAKVLPRYAKALERSSQPNVVETKLMVKLELNLPWKPVLAWPWGVTYTIDPTTNLITEHVESWDIEPLEGVKMIFRKPTVQL